MIAVILIGIFALGFIMGYKCREEVGKEDKICLKGVYVK